jgi:hypothetical protein
MYTVLMALAPVFFGWVAQAADTKLPVGLDVVINHGDLLLVAVAVVATSAGELAGRTRNRQRREIWASGLSFLIGLAATFMYALVVSKRAGNVGFVYTFTIWTYLAACIVGAACIILSENRGATTK